LGLSGQYLASLRQQQGNRKATACRSSVPFAWGNNGGCLERLPKGKTPRNPNKDQGVPTTDG